MKNIILFILFYTINIFPQDTIFRYEEKPITGNIVYTDDIMILYQKGDIIKDIPNDFVYGYKRDGKMSILYKEHYNSVTLPEMDEYIKGRTLGYQKHVPGLPFATGFFSSYFYTYYNTRGLSRNPKFSSLAFTAIPPIIFTVIKPKANKRWTPDRRFGYQRVRSEKNQWSSFVGALLGTAVIYTFYFSSN
jgi:hypothetical protein